MATLFRSAVTSLQHIVFEIMLFCLPKILELKPVAVAVKI